MAIDLSEPTPTGEMVGRLLLAAVFGGLIGWEREQQRKPAGLRTHMLVSLSAAGFTISCMRVYQEVVRTSPAPQVGADPIRIFEAVVGALGFLGAGTIIQSRGSVQGITTAAALWVTGGIGLACGVGDYTLAVATAVPAFLILAVIGRLEGRLVRPGGDASEPGAGGPARSG